MKKSILVSACLLGCNCRYNGVEKVCSDVLRLAEQYHLIPICPEQLGGLPTPRYPSWFTNDDGKSTIAGEDNMSNAKGVSMTKAFLRGAEEAMKIADICGAKVAILKERSPSCGSHWVYNYDRLVQGQGVTTALFAHNRIEIFSEKEIGRFNERYSKMV